MPPGVAALDAEPAAFVRRHQTSLWRYLRVLGAEAELADDLAQEAFVAALRVELVDRGDGGARTWLRTTARNLFLAHCRQRRRTPEVLDPAAVERALDAYEARDDGDTYRAALARCLDGLPQRQRELLLEAARGEVGLERLANGEQMTVEALRSRLRRSKVALRDCVERRMRDGS